MNLLKESDFIIGSHNEDARLLTLKNKNGLLAQFTNYGARWVSMWISDKKGMFSDILLGFDTLSGYKNAGERYHGAIVGRVCGRINNARFVLNNKEYTLASNDVYGRPVKNHLHGGISAFHNRMWEVKEISDESVCFSLFSPDGDEGYPGNLRVEVKYTLTNENALRMECKAYTDAPTVVNLTNHAFFNLQTDNVEKTILSQPLTINSSKIVVCNEELIPTSEISSVKGSFLDFSSAKTMASAIQSANETVKKDNGFSVAFVLDKANNELGLAAILEDKESGRVMELYTNQPSLQVYNGYFMDGTDIGKENTPYYSSAGIALETQGYPDAPNHSEFPCISIDENNAYYHLSEYRFLVK